MDGTVLEEKLSFKTSELSFSSKLDWGSYVASIAKTASRKIGALIRFIFFFSWGCSSYKSLIRPWLEYCYHVWATGPSSYFDMSVKLQKQIYWTVGFLLAAFLELLAIVEM